MKDFELNGEYIELVRLLKLLGLVETGGQAKIMIEQGEVLLNSQPEFRKRAKLRAGDEIEILGRKIRIVTSGKERAGS